MVPSRLAWTLAAAGWFGLLGGLATLALDPLVPSVRPLAPFATVAGALVGGPVWWAAVERGEPTRRRAAVAGGATGLVAHPVLWSVVLLSLRAPVDTPEGLARVVGISGLFGLFGLLLVGWVTVPVGVAGGLAMLVARRRL